MVTLRRAQELGEIPAGADLDVLVDALWGPIFLACSSATPRSTDGSSIGYWTWFWQAPCDVPGANNEHHGSGL